MAVLLEHGADLTARDNLGQTPLHYAVDNQEVDLAITLLNHGAETNAADNNGNTVLHLAARRRNVNMIEILLLYCPDMTLRNYQRKRPADIARESGMVVLATIMQGQRSTPCVVEGTECQTEGGSGVAPLRLLTCSNTTWRTPAPVPPTSTTLDCRVFGQVFRHGSRWHDGCREKRCVRGKVWKDHQLAHTCCVVEGEEHGDGTMWSHQCHQLWCHAGSLHRVALLNNCCRSADGRVYPENSTWAENCHFQVCRGGRPQPTQVLPSCCSVRGEVHPDGAHLTMGCFYLLCEAGNIRHYEIHFICKTLILVVVVAVAGVVISVVLAITLYRTRRTSLLNKTFQFKPVILLEQQDRKPS